MQKAKSSFAKIGLLCAGFCTMAGLTYGDMVGTHFPASPAFITMAAFFNALDWSLLGFILWSVIKRDFKSARGASIAILLSLAVSTMMMVIEVRSHPNGSHKDIETYGGGER